MLLSRALPCLAVVVAMAALVPSAAWAQTESRLSADVSATAGFSNNPFTVVGSDTGSAVVTIDIAPRYQLLTERNTFTVSADADFQQYLRRYGRNDSYSGAFDYRGRPSARLTTHARLDVSSAILGAFGGYLPGASGTGIGGLGLTGDTTGATTGVGTGGVPIVTAPTALVPITDIGLFGLRNRRKSARLAGDIGVSLSARDSLSVSGYGEVTRYANLGTSDYQAYGATLGYSRRMSDRLTLGVQGSASSFDYRSGVSSSRVYSLQATASDRLSDRWTLDGALGASFVNSQTAASTRSTSLSGNFDLCRLGQLSTMCAQASRQVSPTGLAGSQYVTTAGINWNRRLSEHDSVSLGAGYSEVGGGTRLVTGVLPLQTEYAQATAGYNRRLRERLGLVASADYRQLLGSGNLGRPRDFGGQIGLSYRLGDKR